MPHVALCHPPLALLQSCQGLKKLVTNGATDPITIKYTAGASFRFPGRVGVGLVVTKYDSFALVLSVSPEVEQQLAGLNCSLNHQHGQIMAVLLPLMLPFVHPWQARYITSRIMTVIQTGSKAAAAALERTCL